MIIRDGDWTLYDYDHQTGRQVWHLFDGEKDVFRTDYPVEKLIDTNKEQRLIAGSGFKGDYHHIASIPLNVLWDSGLVEAGKQDDQAFISRWLNDSDNRAWRTKDGTV